MRERTDTVIPASLRGRRRLMMRLAAFIVVPAMAFAISKIELVGLPSCLAAWHAKCDIKGNVSTTTGERIYHVPGGKYYAATAISLSKGERWFCSEPEARAAGWRKSRR